MEKTAVAGGVTEELVEFDSGGNRLCGILCSGSRVNTASVLVHGWSTCRFGPHRMFVKLARTLAVRGCASLRFDLTGRGESEGDYGDATLDTMIADTVAAGRFILERTGLRDAGLFGLCSGGNVVLGAGSAEEAGASFKKLVAVSTLTFQEQKTAADRLARVCSAAKVVVRKVLSAETWKRLFRGEVNVLRVMKGLSGGEGETKRSGKKDERTNPKASARNIVADFKNYKGEVLFVYGGADSEGARSGEWFREFGRENGISMRFEAVEGSNHNFYSREWEGRLISLSAGFLAGRPGA